jgi:hypothetical protein
MSSNIALLGAQSTHRHKRIAGTSGLRESKKPELQEQKGRRYSEQHLENDNPMIEVCMLRDGFIFRKDVAVGDSIPTNTLQVVLSSQIIAARKPFFLGFGKATPAIGVAHYAAVHASTKAKTKQCHGTRAGPLVLRQEPP